MKDILVCIYEILMYGVKGILKGNEVLNDFGSFWINYVVNVDNSE